MKTALEDSTYSAAGSSDTTNAGASSISGVLINDRI